MANGNIHLSKSKYIILLTIFTLKRKKNLLNIYFKNFLILIILIFLRFLIYYFDVTYNAHIDFIPSILTYLIDLTITCYSISKVLLEWDKYSKIKNLYKKMTSFEDGRRANLKIRLVLEYSLYNYEFITNAIPEIDLILIEYQGNMNFENKNLIDNYYCELFYNYGGYSVVQRARFLSTGSKIDFHDYCNFLTRNNNSNSLKIIY